MPYRYNGKRSFSIWISEDKLLKLDAIAEELGTTISALINDAIDELIAAWELSKELGVEKKTARRKFALKSVFTRFRARFRTR